MLWLKGVNSAPLSAVLSSMLKILSIEDNELTQKTLSLRFSKTSHKLHLVPSAQMALEHLESEDELPHVILLDVTLPDMDGFEFSVKIKEQEHLKHIPIIFFSAQTAEFFVKELEELDYHDFLVKPVDFSKLFKILDELL